VLSIIPTLEVLFFLDVLVVMASVLGLGAVVVDMDVVGVIKLEVDAVETEFVGLAMLELDVDRIDCWSKSSCIAPGGGSAPGNVTNICPSSNAEKAKLFPNVRAEPLKAQI